MNRWFKDHSIYKFKSSQSIARVTAVDRGTCTVRNEQREFPAKPSGRFQYLARSGMDFPCLGDWVCIECRDPDSTAIIHAVLPRKTFLRRKCAGKTAEFLEMSYAERRRKDKAFGRFVHSVMKSKKKI